MRSNSADGARTNTSTSAILTLTTITGVVSIVGYDVRCCLTEGEGKGAILNHPKLPKINPTKVISSRPLPPAVSTVSARLRTAS